MREKVRALVFGSIFLTVAAVFLLANGSSGSDTIGAWRKHERQAPTRDIGDIRMLPGGKLVAASAGSFHVYHDGRWKKYSYERSVLSNHIPFFSDSKGRLYFNDDGLAIWENGIITRHDSIRLIDPVTCAQAGTGEIYFASYYQETGGVYRFDGNSIERLYSGRVRSLTVDGEGNVWATAVPPDRQDMRLMMYGQGTWSDRTAEIGDLLPVLDESLTVQAAPDGSVWVCNKGPYAVFHGGKWDIYRNVGSGSPISLEFDRQNGVWGSSYGNIYRLDESGKWAVNRTYLSILPVTASVIAASDTAVYTFNSPDSVFVSVDSGKKWAQVPDPNDLGSDIVTSVAYLNDGRLVCGHGVRGMDWEKSEKRGMSVYDGKSWRNFNKFGTYYFPNVYVLKQSPGGLVYFYADGGYYTYDGFSVDSLDSLDSENDVIDIAWDSHGETWYATGKGLMRLSDPNTIIKFTPVMDLYPFVCNLCIDDDDNMYMQTWSTQVLMTDRTNWYQYIPGTGRAVTDIALDKDGNLWGARIGDLAWWDKIYQEWRPVTDFPDSNRLVQTDNQGRVWASGYDKTGYYSGETFHTVPELSGAASNVMACSEDGRIALNAFNRVRSDYFGIREFIPSTVGVKEPRLPVPFLVASSYPNPFNPTVTIRFELPAADRVKIAIYNVTGQRVKQLADRRFAAGVSQVVWDSRTDAGSMASSGVYFYRIEAGKQMKAGKMLLLR